jgi:hypothetical protein
MHFQIYIILGVISLYQMNFRAASLTPSAAAAVNVRINLANAKKGSSSNNNYSGGKNGQQQVGA